MRREIVAARRIGKWNHPRSAVARGARLVERDVSVARPGREQEEIDATRVRDPSLVFGRVIRIGKPDRSLRQPCSVRQRRVERGQVLTPYVGMTAEVAVAWRPR